jgi:enoyl-CoA hydratase/carnithine racemase
MASAVTFNQPEKRNPVSVEMWHGLAEILDAFAEDDEVRVGPASQAPARSCAGTA